MPAKQLNFRLKSVFTQSNFSFFEFTSFSMKRLNFTLRTCLIFLLLIPFTSSTFAESPYKKIVYSAFIARDMTKWEELIRTVEASENNKTIEQKLELINYYYGDIGYLIGKKQYEPAEKLITKGEKLITEVLQVSPKNATALSFKGSFLGFHIGICKYKAVFLGPESKSYINKAIELDPQNVQGLIDKGNLLFYAPRILGGDKKEALIYFLKAAGIMERERDTYENWVYLNVLTMIASSYKKDQNLNEAKLTYEKILGIEPNIVWVKNDLYPKLLAEIKS